MIKWNYELPEKEIVGRRCLVSYKNAHNNQPCIRGGWVDSEEISNNGYAWADYPDDFSKNTEEWKSIYLGDDEPEKGMYLLCLYKRQQFYKCAYHYYDPRKSVFEPSVEVMAWRKINPPEVKGGRRK